MIGDLCSYFSVTVNQMSKKINSFFQIIYIDYYATNRTSHKVNEKNNYSQLSSSRIDLTDAISSVV